MDRKIKLDSVEFLRLSKNPTILVLEFVCDLRAK